MPRSRSIFIQSERVLRRSPLALTWPARLMAPPNSNSFSVSVVLPASGWEMMAKVRRRATSSESGDRDGDSAVAAMSDISRAFGRESGLDQAAKKLPRYRDLSAGLQSIQRPIKSLSQEYHRPIGRRRHDSRGRNGDDPGIDDRTRHVPAHRGDPPSRADADDRAGDGVGG